MEALDFILTRCRLAPRSLLVDIGSGTGISSRQFAQRGIAVLGIEPNADMRAKAEAAEFPPDLPKPRFQPGNAEATGLPDASADAVLAAQAFHWFRPEPALREFHRILRDQGWTVLLWNERNEQDAFTAAYGAVLRTVPATAKIEGSRGQAGQPLLDSPLFQDAERIRFVHEQVLDEPGVLGRAFSTSYAPRAPQEAEPFAAALREVFARYQRQGQVVMKYDTTVYVARRRRL
jgi:SAM-dependent methyltransferase